MHVLHVVPPGKAECFDPQGEAKKHSKANEGGPATRCLEQLRALVPSEARSLGLSVEVEVCEHPAPAEAICHAAERLGADVICLASHGRTGLASAIMGSVATSVLARSKRPLHLIRALED